MATSDPRASQPREVDLGEVDPDDPDADLRAPLRRPLPLQARIEPAPRGWTIRLPVRAEHVRVEKQTFVAEEVVVRTRPVQDTVRVDETVRREEVRVETTGDVDPTVPIDVRPDQGGDPRRP